MPLTIVSNLGPAADAAVRHLIPDAAYEVIGPQVFRFEYCYLLKANGTRLRLRRQAISPESRHSIVDIAVD